MRTPALQTQRLFDQNLAALREAGAPLSTRVIAVQAFAAVHLRCHIRGGLVGRVGEMIIGGRRVVVYEGPGGFGGGIHVLESPPPGLHAYRHLRALGAAGKVARRPGAAGERQMYWTYLSHTRAQWEIAELVALLALDAGSNP